MQYWINHNGVQSGPMDLDALKDMGLTSEAYVWHEGLDNWVKITQLPELQGLYETVVGTPMEPQATIESATPDTPQQPMDVPVQQQQQPVQPYQPQQTEEQPATEPCPPTNLVWAIITTVLCCIFPGIVAIIYSTKVTSKYRQGDIEGAKRASETSAWWCIAAIILGILSMPLMWMIQAGSMS